MKLKFAVFGERDSKSLYCNVRKYVVVFFSRKLRLYFIGVCIVRGSIRMLRSKKVAKQQILKYAILRSMQ